MQERVFFGALYWAVFPQSSFVPHEIEASMRPHGTSVHTTMCCIKGALRHGPVSPRCNSRADHQLLYLSGSKWAYLLISASLELPCGDWATAQCTSSTLHSPAHRTLCTWELSDTSRSSRRWDMPGDNICLPLVTWRVKPTAESRACWWRSLILSWQSLLLPLPVSGFGRRSSLFFC